MYTHPDWNTFFVLLIFTLYFCYQGYINLKYKKITRFGIDAILLALFMKFSSKKTKKRTENLINKPETIIKIGKNSLLIALGGLLAILRWYIENILLF